MYKKSIVLFRKDLRLKDNKALHESNKVSAQVFPLFIFDPRQVSSDNHYKSDNAIDFMVTSLQELEKESHKHQGIFSFAYGVPHEYLEKVFKKGGIEALFLNRDYTPFALERDAKIAQLCRKYNIAYNEYDDGILIKPGTLMTGKNTPYTMFTPFYKQALKSSIESLDQIKDFRYATKYLEGAGSLHNMLTHFSYEKNRYKYVKGGVSEAQQILKGLTQYKNYDKIRDFPSLNTTLLSAHIKFGTVSIRQVYEAVIKESHNSVLLKQLYWREFFIYLGYHYPHVFKKAFRKEYQHIDWSFNNHSFKAWCDGTTGFPIVDAGMRQLNKTGYMHNRVRMIVASFLTKDLHIDWRKGEQYFAQKLTDYDPALNNGNWQWAASTGADAQPYFRIFNPWLQQKKFDPECIYIKKWVPELRDLSIEKIHTYYKNKDQIIKNYPLPIVDYATTSAYAKRFFKK